MRKIDRIIEEITYMIFDDKIDIQTPIETIEQIKSKLYNEGLYNYPKTEGGNNE